MGQDLQGLLRAAQEAACQFLSQKLPELCGADWWKKCVIWKLTFQQERLATERKATALEQLDFPSILRVLEKNWRDLSARKGLPRDARALISEMRNVRNRHAHSSLDTVSPDDQARDADTVARFLAIVAGAESAVLAARQLRDELLRRHVSGRETRRNAGPSNAGSLEDDESREAEEDESEEHGTDSAPKGVPVECFGATALGLQSVAEAMERGTYVGIDFGTSTTVVSVIQKEANGKRLLVKPMPVVQWSDAGVQIEDHLVPTCIAWTNGQLLVGSGAAELRQELHEGHRVWSSFKMRLGIDLGPQYARTTLSEGQGPVVIERPQDAARVFFGYLRDAVDQHVKANRLPTPVMYGVSVPAAFEANQRQDLIGALEGAGIGIEESGLIDEPNAAFLSYLAEMVTGAAGAGFLDSLALKARRVLVFDFGAGTCDISILEVKVDKERLTSRNLAISKFVALGGDDIDRAIAREILLPQLCGAKNPAEVFSTTELEDAVLPRLKPEAEALKIQCSKMAEDWGFRTVEELESRDFVVAGKAIPPIRIRGEDWGLKSPTVSLRQFAEAMRPFLVAPAAGDEDVRGRVPSVLEPIDSALDKAGISADELDMVLFIGGSSANPLVREAVKVHVGGFVDVVTPADLRSHVSRGAAIQSLLVHGLGEELIRPITSEPIFVITRDGGMERVLAAGTPLPSPDIALTELTVRGDRQRVVELPFCVSGLDKVLAVISVNAPTPPGHFAAGERVRLSCQITRDKLLKVWVKIGKKTLTARILNPLANAEVLPRNRPLLEARQALNESILAGRGRPRVDELLNYAFAASEARRWREAAECLEGVERLDSEQDHATNIAYNYAMAGDTKRSDEWSRKAYERDPDSVTAFNFALAKQRTGDKAGFEALMEEALEHNPDGIAALE
ncbi:MAG: Hsp70 family protein, partial [Myxococcota bacterium]|nr:Hsp70 family protein [Myxococcota bacterium]